jgi:hypothetical protein
MCRKSTLTVLLSAYTFGNYMQKNKNYTPKTEDAHCTKQWASPNLERREVEKRIYGVKDCGSRLPLPFMVIT